MFVGRDQVATVSCSSLEKMCDTERRFLLTMQLSRIFMLRQFQVGETFCSVLPEHSKGENKFAINFCFPSFLKKEEPFLSSFCPVRHRISLLRFWWRDFKGSLPDECTITTDSIFIESSFFFNDVIQ
ncbi:hypothetical protein CEXT_2061 [Caerostris extrusa]|uniref:Uncharacterized protein n=1 Tax=Caerostris extrusa TaxID=172846 RepID=A0AAV4VNC6_CAEEX|nr:hypothetical protein CEXT_2061 [Caerostris extrusa]